MSRKRYISTDLSKSGKMEELARRSGEYGVLLFTWMIPHLDDWGRMEGAADKVFFEVTPRFAMTGRTPDDAETALREMDDIGLITRYEVDGELYIQVNTDTFYELQTYIPKAKRAEDKSKYPPPPKKVAQSSTEQNEVAQNTPSPFSLLPSTLHHDDARAGADELGPLAAQIYRGHEMYAADELESYVSDLGEPVVLEAAKRTVAEKPNRPREYFRGICKRWIARGVRSVDEVLALDEEHNRAIKLRDRPRSPPEPSEGLNNALRSARKRLQAEEVRESGGSA